MVKNVKNDPMGINWYETLPKRSSLIISRTEQVELLTHCCNWSRRKGHPMSSGGHSLFKWRLKGFENMNQTINMTQNIWFISHWSNCWKNVIIFITGLFRDVGKQCKEDTKTGKASFGFADSKFGDALPSKTRIWPSGLRSSVKVFFT